MKNLPTRLGCIRGLLLGMVGVVAVAFSSLDLVTVNGSTVGFLLLTALVASHLFDRKRRQEETEQLYALSRAILLTESSRPIGHQAAKGIAQIFASPAVLILDSKSG